MHRTYPRVEHDTLCLEMPALPHHMTHRRKLSGRNVSGEPTPESEKAVFVASPASEVDQQIGEENDVESSSEDDDDGRCR